MKTIFDNAIRSEIEQRIHTLKETTPAQWGKMNAYQMLKHCTMSDDMMHGKIVIKRVFIGRIIGKMILKSEMKEGKAFGKNSPTSPILNTLKENGDFEKQKTEWINRVRQYENYNNPDFVHPFFGRMDKETIGAFVYKHMDHHLRQFGV